MSLQGFKQGLLSVGFRQVNGEIRAPIGGTHSDVAYLDFTNYKKEGNRYYIIPPSGFQQKFSGEIFYYNRNIHNNNFENRINDDTSRDFYVTKSGEFNVLGHRINETGFAYSYGKIFNSEDFFPIPGNIKSGFTYIIQGGKTSRDEAKSFYNYSGFDKIEPFHNKEIILSSINPESCYVKFCGGPLSGASKYSETGAYDGIEIGLNSANLLYIKYYELAPQNFSVYGTGVIESTQYTKSWSREAILTYSADIPARENIWGITYSKIDNFLAIYRFDGGYSYINTNGMIFDFQEKTIGSGILSNLEVYDTGKADDITSSVKLKKLFYSPKYMDISDFQTIAKSMNEDYVAVETKTTGIQYIFSGFRQEQYQITGIINYTNIFSGYISGFYTGQEEIIDAGGSLSGSGIPIYTELLGRLVLCPSGNTLQYIEDFSNIDSSGNFVPYITGAPTQTDDLFSINESNYQGIFVNANPSGDYPVYVEKYILVTGQIDPLAENYTIPETEPEEPNCNVYYVITGFRISYESTGINFSGFDFISGNVYWTPVFYASGITGIIESGIIESQVFLQTGWEIIETGYFFTGLDFGSLSYKTASYIGSKDQDDFVEYITGNKVWNKVDFDIYEDNKLTNYYIQPNYSRYVDGKTPAINTTLYNADYQKKLKLYLNGVAVRSGTASLFETTEIKNGSIREKNIFTLDKDYFITGSEIITNFLFTGDDNILNLHAIADINDSNFITQELIITGIEQYYSGLFSEISPSGKDVYFNGVKIYEGIDYLNINNNLAPIGEMDQLTGVYFAMPKLSGVTYFTGKNIYDIYATGQQYIQKDSIAMWSNGIRKHSSNFLYYDIGVSLITGTCLLFDNGDRVFDVLFKSAGLRRSLTDPIRYGYLNDR